MSDLVRVRRGKTRSENALKQGQAECSSGMTIIVSRSGVQVGCRLLGPKRNFDANVHVNVMNQAAFTELQELVQELAELGTNGFRIHVTLLVRGVVVVGRVISVAESRDLMAKDLTTALRRAAPEIDARKFDAIANNTFGTAARKDPGFTMTTDALLLDNARILNGGTLVPAVGGIAMQIDLASIDGFSLTRIEDEDCPRKLV